ncbi:hypothetical protein ACFL96_13385 [Thermoproteota archaeon]
MKPKKNLDIRDYDKYRYRPCNCGSKVTATRGLKEYYCQKCGWKERTGLTEKEFFNNNHLRTGKN